MDFGNDVGVKEDIDPAAEFLAREQSILGDLESEIITGSNSANAPGVDDNLIGEEGYQPVQVEGVESKSSIGSFEMIANETNEPTGISGPPPSRIEPEKIRKWREEQARRLEEKDREEERKQNEMKQQAKQDLDNWLRKTEESLAKTKAASRNVEKQANASESPIEAGTEWERIAKLCDFNPKVAKSGKDVSRMRSIYLHMKQESIPMQKTA